MKEHKASRRAPGCVVGVFSPRPGVLDVFVEFIEINSVFANGFLYMKSTAFLLKRMCRGQSWSDRDGCRRLVFMFSGRLSRKVLGVQKK